MRRSDGCFIRVANGARKQYYISEAKLEPLFGLKWCINNDIRTQHCYREANRVADMFGRLVTLSHNHKKLCIYYTFGLLPEQIKGLVNTD